MNTKWFWTIATLMALGCSGSSHEKTYPVTGVVTHNGTPVEGASVVMIPSGNTGKSAAAETLADGTFSVKTFFDALHNPEGALIGDYSIVVSKMEKAEVPEGLTSIEVMQHHAKLPKPKSLLPAKYARPETSGYQHTVSDKGKNHLVLELK